MPTTDAKPAIPSSMPTEVLPGFLFLGSYDHASRAELLKALGIGHILNVSAEAVGAGRAVGLPALARCVTGAAWFCLAAL